MSQCDELLDRLEAGEELPTVLLRHAEACETCRQALERTRALGDAGRLVAGVEAPHPLVDRIKAMPRLPLECERSQAIIAEALDGEIDPALRGELVRHLHACRACTAVWEAFATLREVGHSATPPARLRADLAIPPSRRVAVRRRLRFFDLRLATAAVYLVAALTVALVGNPITVARASSAGVEKVSLYTRAAVENRLDSVTRRVREGLAAAEGWARDQGKALLDEARRLVAGGRANQTPSTPVVRDGDGGTS